MIAAVLWYLFQHEATNLVAVTSYTWKAAQLVGSSHNPGYSSSTTFGINPFSKGAGRGGHLGNTAAAMALIHKDVVMILNDEISFTPQAHLQVGACMGSVGIAGVSDLHASCAALLAQPQLSHNICPVCDPVRWHARAQDISAACHVCVKRNHPGQEVAPDAPFAGLHFVCAGDFAQHDPPGARSLYVGAHAEAQGVPPALPQRVPRARAVPSNDDNGRRLWLKVEECVILKEQHRFDLGDEDGRSLYDLVCKLTTGCHADGRQLDSTDFGAIADTINARAVSPSDMQSFLESKPKALVLRHAVRPALSRCLVGHHASASNTRAVVWRAQDSAAQGRAGKRLSPDVLIALECCPSTPDKIPPLQYFYPGIPYRFISNDFPLLGWVNNGECIGHSLILHPDEPADLLTGDFRVLRFPPKAVMVQIPGRDMGARFGDHLPRDCIPVVPKRTGKFKVDWGYNLKLYHDPSDLTSAKGVSIVRTGIPLETALTFTDYFAQGQSFRGEPHFLHLNIGERDSYRKANMLVSVSRVSRLSELRLLHPLFDPDIPATRSRFVARLESAFRPNKDYVADMKRLDELSKQTHQRHYDRLMRPADQEERAGPAVVAHAAPALPSRPGVPATAVQLRPDSPSLSSGPRVSALQVQQELYGQVPALVQDADLGLQSRSSALPAPMEQHADARPQQQCQPSTQARFTSSLASPAPLTRPRSRL